MTTNFVLLRSFCHLNCVRRVVFTSCAQRESSDNLLNRVCCLGPCKTRCSTCRQKRSSQPWLLIGNIFTFFSIISILWISHRSRARSHLFCVMLTVRHTTRVHMKSWTTNDQSFLTAAFVCCEESTTWTKLANYIQLLHAITPLLRVKGV